MGGIRKKTSKRGTTFQRSKIVKKAAETRKKNNRDTRKNSTWKSKKPTDPGIPNSFPFKDQILAELAQAKIAAQEEKERRRLAQKEASKEAKALIASAQSLGEDDDDDEEDEVEVEDEDDEEAGVEETPEERRLRRKIDREVDEDEYLENPGVLPVYGKKAVNPISAASEKKKGKQVEQDQDDEEEEEDDDIPVLVDTELPTIQAALDRSDVVVEVVDARDPIGFRSAFLENLVLIQPEEPAAVESVPNKSSKKSKQQKQQQPAPTWKKDKLVVLLNKIDLVPKETAEAWLKFLRHAFQPHGDKVKVVLFKASFVETPIKPGMTVYGVDKQGKLPARTIPSSIPVGKETLSSILSTWQTEKKRQSSSSSSLSSSAPSSSTTTTPDETTTLNVVFLGQPNVGKSAVINTLLGRPRVSTAETIPVSGIVAPTTKVPVEVSLKVDEGGEVRLIDTPGWEFNPPDVEDEDEDEGMGDDEDEEEDEGKWAVLEEMVARDMLTRNLGRIDKVKDALPLVKQIVNRSNPQDLMLAYNIPHFAAGDIETFLISVARAQGRIRKRGDADVEAAAKTVLRDWAHNLFPYYTLPTKSEIEKSRAVVDESDTKALNMLKTRQELKKVGKGLIRLKVPEVDERVLILDEEMIQDDDDESEGELDEDELDAEDGLDGDDLEESGEEVVFDQDDTPSESEPEVEVVVDKKLDRKRKRKSSLGPAAAAPVLSKKLKTVQFASDEPEVKRAEVKVGTSGKLKRKGGDDEDVSRDGKKVRRDGDGVEPAAAATAVPAKREIKGALKKMTGKTTNGAKEVVAPATKPVKAKKADKPAALVTANGKKSSSSAASTKAAKSTETDQPFDFSAL